MNQNFKKSIYLASVFLIIVIILTVPVSATWWSSLSKSFAKQTEKQVIKQDEKQIIGQGEKTISKQEQIIVNKATGNALDDAFKLKWCETHKCGTSADELRKSLKFTDTVYITNDWEAKRYINEKFDPSFTRRPDMLEVKTINGNIRSIKIYDTKTSADAIVAADARGQSGDYEELCKTLNTKKWNSCSIQYVLPEEEANKIVQENGGEVILCLAIGLAMVPDPTDLLCLLEL